MRGLHLQLEFRLIILPDYKKGDMVLFNIFREMEALDNNTKGKVLRENMI